MIAMPMSNINKTNIAGKNVHPGEGNTMQVSAVTTAKHNMKETETKANSLIAILKETSRNRRQRTNVTVNNPNPNVRAVAIEKVSARRA